MQRYVRKVYNISIEDDNSPIRNHLLSDENHDEDAFFVLVKDKVKQWSKELNQNNNFKVIDL